MPPGPYRATTCRGRELNYESHTYFFDHTRTWRDSQDQWSAQCRGHLRDSTNMNDNTHQAHTQSSQQGEYGMMITSQMIFGDLRGQKFPDICLTGEEKPRKNLTQETCPDRGLNPGPLRDNRACYHLLHSGGRFYKLTTEIHILYVGTTCYVNRLSSINRCILGFLCFCLLLGTGVRIGIYFVKY